jgi:hypothetical protein
MAAFALAAGISQAQVVANNPYGAMIMMNNAQNQLTLSMINANQTINRRALEATQGQNSPVASQTPPAAPGTASPYTSSPAFAPVLAATPVYPLEATDFRPGPRRIAPDQLANAVPGANFFQKLSLKTAYNQFLVDYEAAGRRNNVAAAISFAVYLSLTTVYGRNLSPWETQQIMTTYNNALAANPQFNAMTPQQKQMLYENMIIVGGTMAALQSDGIRQNNYQMQAQARELGQTVLQQWYHL